MAEIGDRTDKKGEVLDYGRPASVSRGGRLAQMSFLCMAMLVMASFTMGLLVCFGMNLPPRWLLWFIGVTVPAIAAVFGVMALRQGAGTRRAYALGSLGLVGCWYLLLIVDTLHVD